MVEREGGREGGGQRETIPPFLDKKCRSVGLRPGARPSHTDLRRCRSRSKKRRREWRDVFTVKRTKTSEVPVYGCFSSSSSSCRH